MISVVEISPWQVFLKGGPIMWPILLCSIFALTIIIERAVFFFSIKDDVAVLKAKIFDAMRKNDLKAAVSSCDAVTSPVARIFRSGLMKFGQSRVEIEEAMEGASQIEVPRLEKGLPSLSLICSVAPLLGFLGTVIGIASAFYSIQVRAVTANPSFMADVTGGIWGALITTVAGFLVAIPTFIAYRYCLGQVNAMVLQMEKAALDLAIFLEQTVVVSGDGKETL